ncbi:hypothetical protein [Kutzneria sp. CA-103260]|uniref:hypothetical protein n=1 Tax=Kutzneria sp. CA-103260 TaxID=2802641 RepID=UPI001BA48E66|nr:hypothetical protein [Kutzneria sp. CA-103260]QUQ72502.1 hypothetical protein JJ691_102910 [Kutzneria sp. CA-103260]
MVITVLYVIHTMALAGWFGTQIYSVLLVQRHPAQDEDPEYFEDFAARLANGSRYTLLGVIAAMIPTWVVIIALRAASGADLGVAWVWLVVVKSLAMLVAIGLFAYLSWHVWPLRIFALRDELPAVRRRFYGLSVGILCGTGLALGVGIVEQSVGSFLGVA